MLEESNPFYKELLDNLYDGVYFVDTERKITYWNKGAERISGFSREQVLGTSCADNILIHVDGQGNSLCATACPLVKIMKEGGVIEAAVFLHHAGGHRLPVLVRAAPMTDGEGNTVGAVEIFSDNTAMFDARQQMEELDRAAHLDMLTGVANRRGIEQKLDYCMAEYRQTTRPFALLFIDIDFFKRVNDRYGHEAGDKVLATVAQTLRANLRTTDCIGRWGGEEFLVILREIDTADVSKVAEKLRIMVANSRPHLPHGEVTPVTISIGAATSQEHDTIETLLQRADRYLSHSKDQGRNRVTLSLQPD
jgi:diguanylate cyclase (GGDEF)-like protein/PAS domain S-box-containing protein